MGPFGGSNDSFMGILYIRSGKGDKYETPRRGVCMSPWFEGLKDLWDAMKAGWKMGKSTRAATGC